jgi:hypothetical protein
MPASSSRRILLLGIFVLGLIGVVGYFVFGNDPVDPGELEVFAPPKAGKTLDAPTDMKNTSGGTTKIRVHLRLRTLARVLPERQPRPTCELVTSLQNPEPKGIEGTWVAGLAALPISRVVRGQQLVRFRLADGRDHYRVTRLLATDRGRILLLRGRMKTARGKVVDTNGRPLQGASVWIAGESATTDAEGKFAIDAIPADSGLPLVVRHKGYAALYRRLSGAQYDALHERPLTLREGVELHVRFNATDVDPDASYHLLPAGGRDSRLLEYPFFMQAISDVSEVRERMVVFPNLPRGARVRVRVVHSGFAPTVSGEIRLDQPMVAAVLNGTYRPTIAATVVDPAGKPVADAWVTSRPGDSGLALSDTGWLLAPLAYVGTGDVMQTSTSGAFSLSRLTDERGRTALTVEAEGFFGLEFTRDGIVDHGLTIGLYPLAPQQPIRKPSLVLRAGPKLTGTVSLSIRDEQGDHGPYSWDCAEPFPLRISQRSLLRVEERFAGATVARDVIVIGETTLTLGR